MVTLSKTRLGLDINRDGGHRALRKKGGSPIKDGEHQRKGGVEEERAKKYGLGKSNRPELGNRASHTVTSFLLPVWICWPGWCPGMY